MNRGILDSYLNRFLFLIQVNTETAEIIDLQEDGKVKEATYEDFIKNQILPIAMFTEEERKSVEASANVAHIKAAIDGGQREFAHNLVMNINGDISWYSYEMMVPEEYSEKNPWIIVGYKKASECVAAAENAIRAIGSSFFQILKMDLTRDEVSLLHFEGENVADDSEGESFTKWWLEFGKSGAIIEEDWDQYYAVMNLDSLRQYFKEGNKSLKYRYRRKIDDEYRWVASVITKSSEYSDDNQVVIGFIRDIHDDYADQMVRQRELEYYCYTDVVSGIQNRVAYMRTIEHFAKDGRKPLGIVFGDLNGLKQVNDNYGHEEGDKYIRTFAEMLSNSFGRESCYRISGDEFVVIFYGIEEDFNYGLEALQQEIKDYRRQIAALGYLYEGKPKSIELLIKEAEMKMYKDKKAYYEVNKLMGRRVDDK